MNTATVSDLRSHLTDLVNGGAALDTLVVVEESPEWPGEVVFEPITGEQSFYLRYRDWVSRYLVLNELFNLNSFVTRLRKDGYTVVFGASASPILDNISRWSEPLDIEGYDLYPFQSFGLRRAMDTGHDFFFWNWSTGAGKTYISAAGAKEMFDRDRIDLVLAFTMSKLKINMCRFFEQAGLDAVVNDGDKRKRERVYTEAHQVYVANYEKSWVDYDLLENLVSDRRVLFILDECSKVISDGPQNKSRRAIDRLNKASRSAVMWPMSASVVGGNPLRYRDVFSLDGHPRRNPLGTKAAFIDRYADRVNRYDVTTRSGGSFQVISYEWNLSRLHEIRHRVGERTQAIRKTDPGVREQFKGLQTIMVPVQMSREERSLVDIITQRAHEARDRGEGLMPYYRLLRYVCNTPRALEATEDEVGREIAREHPRLVAAKSTKLEMLCEQLESIREAGDKCLVFTHWTNLTLHLIKDSITVPYVTHWGTGQSNKESQRAQDKFKQDPDITCFLTSDAGSHGLNMQCARICLQYEPLYSYDDSMQRASRIDRSDSHLDGLTNYVFCTENSVEQRVWNIQQERRNISAAVQGTHEPLSYGRSAKSEAENLEYLIFGEG